MGFMLGSEHFSPYGPGTERAFGHIGFTTVLAWADPDRALSVGLLLSGKPLITPGQVRWLQLTREILAALPARLGRPREATRQPAKFRLSS